MFKEVGLWVIVIGCLSLLGCSNHRFASATKFTTYEDFKAGPENGVELIWARIGLRSPERLQNKLQQYDSVIIDRVYVVVEDGEISTD